MFGELFKFKHNNFKNININYWRIKAGAEVDFVIYNNKQNPVPIEVKYTNLSKAQITRGFHSFVEAYNPRCAFIVTKSFSSIKIIGNTKVQFYYLARAGRYVDNFR